MDWCSRYLVTARVTSHFLRVSPVFLPPPAWPASDPVQLQLGPSPGLGSTSSQTSCPVGVTFLVAPRGIYPQLPSLAPQRALWLPHVLSVSLAHPWSIPSFHQHLARHHTQGHCCQGLSFACLVTSSGFQMTSHVSPCVILTIDFCIINTWYPGSTTNIY